MSNEIFVAYPSSYAYLPPYLVAPSFYAYYAPVPVAAERPKLYGPYGPYTYGPY